MDAMTLLRRFRQNERGAELVEFALVLPLLLAMLAGIVDFGRMFQRLEVTTNAAREGARLATLPGYSPTDVQNRVRAYMDQGIRVGAGAQTTATRTFVNIAPGGGGAQFQAAQVVVNYTDSYLILGPIVTLIGGNAADFGTVTLSATSTMRMETAGAQP
jgi:Flp pilus assembly protein TadG